MLLSTSKNPTFKVQNHGDNGFWDVGYDIMKEDYSSNHSDFRFEIPNESCIIRATFYVVPMGRDVIFYIDFSDIHEGSSDFVTSVEVREPEPVETEPVQTQAQPVQTEAPEQTTAPQTTASAKETTTKATTKKTAAKTTKETTTTAAAAVTTTTTTVTTAENYSIPDTVENNANGAAFFDEKGKQIYPLADKKETAKEENKEERSIVLPIAIACGVCVIACVGGIVFYRKRRA